MSQGNLPLRVAVNISAVKLSQAVVVAMLMCFCSGCFKHLLVVALKVIPKPCPLDPCCSPKGFCISSSWKDFAAVPVQMLKGRYRFGVVKRGVSIGMNSLPVCT